MNEEMADLRSRLGTLYNRVTILENKTPEPALTKEEKQRVFEKLEQADAKFRKAWTLLGEARHMLAPGRKVPRGYQATGNGEQIGDWNE